MIMKDKNKVLQYAGGGLIVAAAFALMLPGWLFYLAGLWRIISLVVTMLVVAWLVVYIYHKLCPPKKNQSRQPANNGVNEHHLMKAPKVVPDLRSGQARMSE